MTTNQLENILVQLWGSTVKPFNVPKNSELSRHIDINSLSEKNLIYLLDLLLKSSSSSMYGFSVDRDNYDILQVMRTRFYNIKSTSRRLKPILRCYDILYTNHRTQEGLFPLATMYLVAEMEHLLKSSCVYLDKDGIIVKEIPRTLRQKLSSPHFRVGKRINQIGDVIKIYCYRNNSHFSIYLKNLDKKIIAYNKFRLKGCYNSINGKKIKAKYNHIEIVNRINQTRNLLMHGDKSYLNSEIFFYLTLHSIFYLEHQDIYDIY